MSTTTEKTTVSYWDNNATFSEHLDRLTPIHMPNSGEATTLEGELIRIVNRLVHEHCNNGNINLMEIEYRTEEYFIGYDEDGDEEYDEEESIESAYINEFYQNMLDLVSETIPTLKHAINRLEAMVEQYAMNEEHYKFNQKEFNVYNEVIDGIMEYVVNREGNFTPFTGYNSN